MFMKNRKDNNKFIKLFNPVMITTLDAPIGKWLAMFPINFIADSMIFITTLTIFKYPFSEIKNMWKKTIFKIWIFGFIADVIGLISMFFMRVFNFIFDPYKDDGNFIIIKIIPILICGKKPMLISCLAKALRVTFEKHMEESLVIVSSNVSRNPDPALALSMADEFRSTVEVMDTKGFLASLAAGRISACGAAILGALLESGLLDDKNFSSLCPLLKSKGEDGETVYYGAFAI